MNQEIQKANTLSTSMAKTIKLEVNSILGDLFESGIDVVSESDILREIPIISTVVSVYKIGRTVRDSHFLKKFAVFLSELETVADRNVAREKYQEYFEAGDRSEEIECLTIVIDRYMEDQQAVWLARLYAAMLDGKLTYADLRVYAQVLERLLPGDYEKLRDSEEVTTTRSTENAALLRLVGLGLVIELPKSFGPITIGETISFDHSAELAKEERKYRRTEFGNQLVELIEEVQ